MLIIRCSSLYPEIHCSAELATDTDQIRQVGRHKEKTTDLYLGGNVFESQLGQRHLLTIYKDFVIHSTHILGQYHVGCPPHHFKFIIHHYRIIPAS